MPFQIDPEPGENEIECGNCGAILYEPEADEEMARVSERSSKPGIVKRLKDALHRLTGKPYAAEQVFGDSLDQAVLYNDLLVKVGGDRAAVERLIDYERQRAPHANRSVLLRSAIRHWERDNRVEGK